MDKRLFGILSLLFFSNVLFADSYGFTLNHSGFLNWIGGIGVFIIAIIVLLGIWVITSDEFMSIIPTNRQWLYLFPGLFSVISFWIFPTYFCSFLGLFLGGIVSFFFIDHKNKFSIICGLLCAFDLILSITSAARYLPQDWWSWKYYCLAVLFLIISQSISYIFYFKRPFAIILLSFITITTVFSVINVFTLKVTVSFEIILFIFVFLFVSLPMLNFLKMPAKNFRI